MPFRIGGNIKLLYIRFECYRIRTGSLLIKVKANRRSPNRIAIIDHLFASPRGTGEAAMTTILSNPRSKFGMTCVQCSDELLPPNGPSIGMSGKSITFGTARNVAHVSGLWPCFLPKTSQ